MYKNKNKGFTFIELILYMAILGIFMVAVLSLVSSTVSTHKRQKSRQKLQTQATETYDTISNMLMGATDVKVYGKGYVSSGTGYVEKTANFIVPEDTYSKSATGAPLYTAGGIAKVAQQTVGSAEARATDCYDIADVKSFSGKNASQDVQTFIDTDYLWIQYAASLEKTAYCTITYNETDRKLYVYRTELNAADVEQAQRDMKSGDPSKIAAAKAILDPCKNYMDSSKSVGTVLANNVAGFQLQVNPDDNSMAVIIDFEDSRTGEKYDVTSVVGLRNSFVLKKHEWN